MTWDTSGRLPAAPRCRLVDKRHARCAGPSSLSWRASRSRPARPTTTRGVTNRTSPRPRRRPTPWARRSRPGTSLGRLHLRRPAGRHRRVRRHGGRAGRPDADRHAGRRQRPDDGRTASDRDLDWAWPIGPTSGATRPTATLTPARRRVAGRLGRRALVEPRLRERRPSSTCHLDRRARGDILGAAAPALVTDRPVVRFGIDRTQVPAARAGGSARAARPAGRHRPGGVRQAGRGRRRRRRSSRRSCFRKDDVPPAVLRGVRRRSRAPSRSPDQLAAGPDPGVRRADPRHGRRGDRRDGRGGPGPLPGRRRGRAVRPPGEVRRAAARHATARSSTRSAPTARSASSSGVEPSRGEPLRADPRPSGCRPPPRRRSPASGRPARWWRSGRRPATILAAANGPGHRRLQHRDLRPVRARVDVQDASAAWRCCGPG